MNSVGTCRQRLGAALVSFCGCSLRVAGVALEVRHTLRWWDRFVLRAVEPYRPRPFLSLLCGLCGAWEDLALALDVLEL